MASAYRSATFDSEIPLCRRQCPVVLFRSSNLYRNRMTFFAFLSRTICIKDLVVNL
jgi:hypothetical protein